MTLGRRLKRRIAKEESRLRASAKAVGSDPNGMIDAYRKATGAIAGEFEHASTGERDAADLILDYIRARLGEMAEELGSVPDPVILATMPDDSDRAYYSELARLEDARGDADASSRLRTMSTAGLLVRVISEREALSHVSGTAWLDLHRKAITDPILGAIPVIYDGTECGHGVAHIVVHSARGGVA